jgi:hypothetical protein
MGITSGRVFKKFAFALGGSLFLVSCSGSDNTNNKNIARLSTEAGASTCPVYESTNWQARIKKTPNDNNMYELHISGDITLPHPGYNVKWVEGPTDRMNPPGMRISIQLSESDAMTIQVITTLSIEQSFETPISSFRQVSIYCGNRLITQFGHVGIENT